MNTKSGKIMTLLSVAGIFACEGADSAPATSSAVRSYADDVAFLREHTEIIELSTPSGARIAIAPAWQGRVMTSTTGGTGFGWINDAVVKSGKFTPQITVFGGEERFWIGPEGGQFSWYFPPKAAFDFSKWQVPAFIDTMPWKVDSKATTSATFSCSTDVTNWSGRQFKMKATRTVRMLGAEDLGFDLPAGVSSVAYRSENHLTNTGDFAWTDKTGMPSIWLLCMLRHGPQTTVVIPTAPGEGKPMRDDYFGSIPADRLTVINDRVFFKGDGKQRGKIGIPPGRSLGLLASWDAKAGVLTLLRTAAPKAGDRFVNSTWKIQEQPFAGDMLNSYNDGPNDAGGLLGPFYELETSSPALALTPGATGQHFQTMIHLSGDRAGLNAIAKTQLGVGLDAIEQALPQGK